MTGAVGEAVADAPGDYAILVSLYMREEAEVMAAALRAEGIDAFVGNSHNAYFDWGYTIALGGLQVMVPRTKLQDAKEIIRARIAEAKAQPEGEPVGRRDRYKMWLVIAGYFGMVGFIDWLSNQPRQDFVYAPAIVEQDLPTYFAAPSHLSEAEQHNVLRDYCSDRLDHTVISVEDGMGYITLCRDVMQMR